MGFWDDVKDFAGDAKDKVVDVFDGSDEKAPKAQPIQGQRPQYQGNAFQTVNPAYQKRENEFDKPLWMPGANQESPYSSWDNDFLKRTFDQQKKLVDEGKYGDQFDRKDATGVVTWDHVTKGGKELKFGDIFDNGKLVGNLYEDKTGTTADADLMMGQLLLEPEELAQIGEDRKPEERMRSVIEGVREKNNVEVPQRLQVAENQKEIDKTQKGIQESAGGLGDDLAAIASGVVGGVTLGAAAGPWGMLAGGIGGGAAAWLNRDDFSELLSSTLVQTEKGFNDDQGNVVGDTASAIKGWAGVAGRSLTPLSNLARGVADTDRGNGVGALQEADRPGWAKPLDIVAGIGDMGLTFGSTAGIRAYTGQMGAHTAGAITELTLGGGMRWDAQAGEFRNVYEDEDGDFSAANALGAWGSTGIDLAQLAMVQGMGAKIKGATTGMGEKAVGKEINGKTVASVEEKAGRTFYLDADKKVITHKANLSQVFIPSEGVQFLAAGGIARGMTAKGAAAAGERVAGTTADDLYKASVSITRAEAPIKAALINAIGEGTEEAVQEALDTWSFDHDVDLQTLAEAYAYGAASGLGMGFAANYRTRTQDNLEMNMLTRSGYEAQHGPQTDEEWAKLYKQMSAQDRKGYQASNYTEDQKNAMKKALGTSVQEQGGSTANGLIISNSVAKAVESEQEKLASKDGIGGRTIMRAGANMFQSLKARNESDGTVNIENGAVKDDTGPTGFTGLLTQYREKLNRLPEILESIDRQIAEAQQVQADQNAKGADTKDIESRIADLQDTRALWAGTQPTLEKIIPELEAIAPVMMKDLHQEGLTEAEILKATQAKRAQLDRINQYLDKGYRDADDSVALAFAKFRLRPPFDNIGSFYVSGPSLDWTMVRDNFDATEMMDWAALDVTTADFDGDRITGTTSLILGRRGFRAAQAGITWLNSVPDAKTGETVTAYKEASTGHDEAIAVNLHLVHKGMRTPGAKKAPARGMQKFMDLVAARYQLSLADRTKMEKDLLAALFDVQNGKPIETLMTYVAQAENAIAKPMVDYAIENKSNEASALAGIYRAAMDQAVSEVNQVRWADLPPAVRGDSKPPPPNQYGTGPTIRSQEAVSLYSTFMQYFGTQDSLRIGQVLRQSHVDYNDVSAKNMDANALLVAAGAELRELAKGKIDKAFDGGLDPFDVTARVHEMALEITEGREDEAFDLLTREFGQVSWDGKEAIRAQHNVTVAQALTDAVVTQLRRQGAVAISRDVDLQRKLDLLETAARDTQSDNATTRSNGAGLILRDALGMFNVADVAGISSTAGWETSGLLAAGTIAQNARVLGKHDRRNRARLRKSMDEATKMSSRPESYRAMVALIHEMANTEYSIESDGNVVGRLADRNEKASTAANEIRRNVIEVVQTMGLPLTHEGVLEALSTQQGAQIFEAFIKQTGIASFVKRDDGSYAPRSWVLDYFTKQNDGEAEVLLWRNRAYTALHLASTRQSLSSQLKDQHDKDEYERVDDTLAKLMIYFRETNPMLLTELQIQLDRATSRHELEKWINANSLNFDMPVLMYENSAAQFDPTLRSGGWGAANTTYGTDIREVQELSRTFLTRTKELVDRRAVDVAAASSLLGMMNDPTNGKVMAANAALQEAANVDAVRTMDPNDMLEGASLIHEFGQEMYTKGADLEALRAHAAQQVGALVQTNRVDPFVDSVNLALGVLDISVLKARPNLIFTTSAFTDEWGRQVKVPNLLKQEVDAEGNVTYTPDLKLVLTAIVNNSDTNLADLLSEAILPLAHKYNRAADVSTTVYRGPRNLKELFEQRYAKAFGTAANGAYSAEADLAFLAETDAAAQTADQFAVALSSRATIAISTPRMLGSKSALSASEKGAITAQSAHQLAKVLRMAGQYINSAEGSKELFRAQVLDVARDLVAKQVSGQRMRQEGMNKLRPLTAATRQEIHESLTSVLADYAGTIDDRRAVDEIIGRLESGRYTQEQANALVEQMIADPGSGSLARFFRSALKGEPFGDLEYVYGTSEVQVEAQKKNIAAYLNLHKDIDGRILHDPAAKEAIAYFRDPTVSYAAQKWDVLRNIVISDTIQAEANPVTSQSDLLVVFTDPIRQDPTFSTVLKELLLPDNPLVAAAVGVTKDHVVPVDLLDLRKAMEDLFPADGTIRWDQSIGAGVEMFDAAYPSISAGQAATIHGNTGKTANAMSMAARTNKVDVPPAEYLQTVRVRRTADGLQILDSTIGTEYLDGAIGIPGDKILDPMVVEGVAPPYTAMTQKRLENVLVIGEELDVQIFHPMHRPPGAKWHNSVYFDGVPGHNSPIVPDYPSIIAAMYMQPNGITQRGTRFTLDAVKKKTPALYRTAVTPQGNLDLNQIPDPTDHLTAIATVLAGTELGYGSLGAVSFRPILKYVTMRHVVKYADGSVSSVYEYMAQRALDPAGIAARGPELVIMSERTANTFYGEVGTSGLQGFVPDGRLSYGQQMFNWDARTDLQTKVLENLSVEPVPLGATSAAKRSALGEVSRGQQTEFRTARRDFGALYSLMAEAAAVQVDRLQKFDSMSLPISRMQANQKAISNSLLANDQQGAGMQATPIDASESLIAALGQQDIDFNTTTAYRLVLGATGNLVDGNVTVSNFGAIQKTLGDLTFGDSIVLALDHLNPQDVDEVLKIVRFMINNKVMITVRGGKSSELRNAVQALLLQTNDYVPLENQTGVYAPQEAVAVYQMERAYISRAMEQRHTTAESRLLTFIPDEGQSGFGSIGESAAAILNPGKRQVVRGVLMKQFSSQYLTPIHRASTETVGALISSPEFADALRAATPKKPGSGLTHEEAVADLLKRAKEGTLALNSKNLQIRKGMFEVYVVKAERSGDPVKVYLHRVGDKFIKEKEIVKLRRSARSFVLNPKQETEPQQTIVEGRNMHPGKVRGDGLLLDIESDQFWRNNKLIPHMGGNKVMTQGLAEDLDWLRENIAGDLSFDLVTNATDSMKKLSMMDAVRDFASAAELLGFDNMNVFYRGAFNEVFDPNSDESKKKMSALRTALNTVAKNNSGSYAEVEETIEFLAHGAMTDSRMIALTTLLDDVDITQRLGAADLGSPHTRVLLAAIKYLTLPGAELSGIESAGGFTQAAARQPGLGSRRMPDMFTRIYDLADDTRELALEVFNARLASNVEMLNDWSVLIRHGDEATSGRIAFSNYSVVGETQGLNYDETAEQGVSSHDQRVLEQAMDAFFANSFDAGAFTQFVEDATASDAVASLRTAPTQLSEDGKTKTQKQPWWNIGLAQQFYRNQVAQKLKKFFDPIVFTDDESASEADIQQVKDEVRKFAKLLFRDDSGDSDLHVHTMIRLMLGRPGASKADEQDTAKISLAKVRLALEAMTGNVNTGYSPLRRGAVSLVPLEIRNAIIKANLGKEGSWAPKVWTDRKLSKQHADSIDTYTRAFFDHSLADPEANNVDAFNNVMDAIYHQYQESAGDAMSLPVSLDLVKDLRLISFDHQAEKALDAAVKSRMTMAEFAKENPGALATSLFRAQEVLLTPAVVHEMTNSATMAQKIGMGDGLIDYTAPSAEVLQYVEARLAAYNRKRDIPFPTKRSTQQAMDSGGSYKDNDSNSHRIMRNLLALHAGKALFNPPLMLGALIDSRMRLTVADLRRLATGESIGFVGRRMASVVESQRPDGRPTAAAALARGLGWRVMYTPKQIDEFNRVLNTTALTSHMNEVIYEELSTYASSLNNKGVIWPILKLNKIATAMQDIGHGTKGKTMRSTYMQAAIAHAVLRQGADLDTVLAGLSYNGGYLANHPELRDAHRAGVQAMNDLRGTQETVISSAISAVIRPITHSGNAGVNAVAQMTLAMPLMFQRYAANLFLTLTGARAFDQLAAHALNGRKKPGFWNELSAKARSEDVTTSPYIDMGDVIGGLDAMDAIINMGVTHSLLFTGGLIAGGLGLGGEDDEEKRRRRAAAAQGAVWLSDPREIENDFRNAHALFLDEIPGLNMLFRNESGRAIASPHWIIKPLTSPLLGMERFFDTGDIRQLKWGFEDAITSMPLLNMVTLNKALTMSEELSHAAQDAAASGNMGASDTSNFLTHMVSYYESALFESSFLNYLYVGMDDYDRDPYVMPLRDSDGDLQRDAEGNTRANRDQHLRSDGIDGRGLALQSYVDDEGNVKQGYWAESDSTTKSRIMAESRLSFALISSLVTGLQGKGMNTRYDMAVKTRSVEKPEMSQKEQVAAVLGAYMGEAKEEVLKGGKQSPEQSIVLSLLDHTGTEVLTDKGAKAIYDGLFGGSVTAGAPALQGIYIDFETRKKLQEQFLDELTIEGMRLGLSESSAKYRANRVWKGDGNLPGMAEILWSDDVIPYSKTQEFQQLNTTYITGPDGNLWATGFERQKLLGALGLAPLQGMHTGADTHTGMDDRMNVAGFGINNTGMRSLRPVNDSLDTPTDAEIGDAITKAIEDLDLKDYGSGYGRRGGGGGGGGGYAQRPVNNNNYPARWTNQNFNPIVLRTPYANDVYSIRTDDVRTDNSPIRRERISSERGRLTQWQ